MTDESTSSGVSSIEQALLMQPAPSASRYRWRVRDCVFCSWRELAEEYSIGEMWSMLMRGRYVKAVRLDQRSK